MFVIVGGNWKPQNNFIRERDVPQKILITSAWKYRDCNLAKTFIYSSARIILATKLNMCLWVKGNISHKANIGVVSAEKAYSQECCVLCSGLHMTNLFVDNPCWWLIKSVIRACGQDDKGGGAFWMKVGLWVSCCYCVLYGRVGGVVVLVAGVVLQG